MSTGKDRIDKSKKRELQGVASAVWEVKHISVEKESEQTECCVESHHVMFGKFSGQKTPSGYNAKQE